MVVLISPEKDLQNEIAVLHELFELGLGNYHLRKPNQSIQKYAAYLNQIDCQYHSKIMIHDHHQLAKDFNIKGLHFKEKERLILEKNNTFLDCENWFDQYVSNLQIGQQTLLKSTSFHNLSILEACHLSFDYCLLSPVMDSISKTNYYGKQFNITNIDKKIIGLGSVSPKNIYKVKEMGYNGVAVLGSVWHVDKSIENYKKIQKAFAKI